MGRFLPVAWFLYKIPTVETSQPTQHVAALTPSPYIPTAALGTTHRVANYGTATRGASCRVPQELEETEENAKDE